jgi:hypothetical protein
LTLTLRLEATIEANGTAPFFRAKTDEEKLEEARILSLMMSRARHGI